MAGFVEIPGFAEAVKREQAVRRQAWAGVRLSICGVKVRDLTLRDLETLEELQNGFFCPWRFDTDLEYLAHCAQLVWYLSDAPKPTSESVGWESVKAMRYRRRLNERLAGDPARLARETRDFLHRQFMDAPKGSSESMSAATAAGAAYVIDTLAAGGYSLPLDELLDLPLPKLWQLVRLVQRRVFGHPLTNPSDKLATDYLATLAAKPGNN